MELNDYQNKAMKTRMPSCRNTSYMLLNLVSEVGEFAGKLAKHIRHEDAHIVDDSVQFDISRMSYYDYRLNMDALKKEAGDILWQLAGLCADMNWTLEDVAQENLEKLASRQSRGVIDGNGDNR